MEDLFSTLGEATLDSLEGGCSVMTFVVVDSDSPSPWLNRFSIMSRNMLMTSPAKARLIFFISHLVKVSS